MEYPQEFNDNVKALLPEQKDLHEALDNNNRYIGGRLEAASKENIPPLEIVKAIEQGEIQDLQHRAEQIIKCKKLYHKWLEIINNQPS